MRGSLAQTAHDSSQIEKLYETVLLFHETVPTKPCFPLLIPTTNHFCPHLNLTTILVKRIRALVTLFFEMCDQNFFCSRHATCWARFLLSSPYFVAEFSLLIRHHSCNIFMQKQSVDFRAAAIEVKRICAANFSFCRTGTRDILEPFEPLTRSLTYGMDHTSARRDRPQLRNQLLRQRRTLVGGSSLFAPSTYGTFRKGRASARPLPCSNALDLRNESPPAKLEPRTSLSHAH
jgi:hypothetical protein